MIKKIVPLFSFCFFLSTALFAQSVRENIEKRAKDPKTEENAAKADRYIADNKSLTDSTYQANQTQINKKKKKKCCRKQ